MSEVDPDRPAPRKVLSSSASRAKSIKVIQLDGLVLLKILKHCKEQSPDIVTGSLLGMERGASLEVTNSFPYLADEEDNGYVEETLKCMDKVKVDNNTVGWYQSSLDGSFFSSTTIQEQYNFQKEIPSSICIVHEPQRTSEGKLSIKAYRLTDAYMKLHDAGKFTVQAFEIAGMTPDRVFREVPIKVHNSHLVHAFLYELRENKALSCDSERLRNSMGSTLVKNMRILSSSIDSYANEQRKFQSYQRDKARQSAQQKAHLQKMEDEKESKEKLGQDAKQDEDLSRHPLFKKIDSPNRLESMLICKQIDEYCGQVVASASESFHKLYTLEALIKSDSSLLHEKNPARLEEKIDGEDGDEGEGNE